MEPYEGKQIGGSLNGVSGLQGGFAAVKKQTPLNRLFDALEALRNASKQTSDVADRLCGPPPPSDKESSSTEGLIGGAFAEMDNISSQMSRLAERISSDMNRISSRL